MPYYSGRSSRPSLRRSSHSSFGGGSSSGRRRTPNRGGRKEYIHPSRFVQAARLRDEAPYEPTHSFADFAFSQLIQDNLARKGITTPTPIQDQAIQPGLDGRDIVGVANTGTGKTIAFAIPILERLMKQPQSRALIMAPTRELAQQIEAECRQIGKGMPLYGALLIGGAAIGPQLRDLRTRPRIVIGTPGRIKDHLERRSLSLDRFDMVVLDEVDRMLDMGFIADMKTILQQLAPNRQSLFFSATMEPKVRALIDDFTHDSLTISVKVGETSDNVEQDIVPYSSAGDKIEKLHDLLIKEEVAKVLVFDETQRGVERLHRDLLARGFRTDAIHGGKSQGQRQRALAKFKQSEVNILVATDVAARGIDVVDITHVINYSTPQAYDDYVHRIGRAGRAGRKGYALTFIEA